MSLHNNTQRRYKILAIYLIDTNAKNDIPYKKQDTSLDAEHQTKEYFNSQNFEVNSNELDDFVDLNSDIDKFISNYHEKGLDSNINNELITKHEEIKNSKNDSKLYKDSKNSEIEINNLKILSNGLISIELPNEFTGIEESSDLEDFNIHDLYQMYDLEFFEGLLGPIKLEWSKRMTQCAGIFSVRGNNISIRLSEPLLKYRSIKEIKETLLHEMTHAYLFMKGIESGRDGHGPKFLEKIDQINRKTGLHLTVYHSFHDEVDYYKTHIWRCNGKCQNEKPYYGYVKRSMNRPPGEYDFWWQKHKSTCGGNFIKISEPENYKKNKGKVENKDKIINKKSKKVNLDSNQFKLKDFFKKNNMLDN